MRLPFGFELIRPKPKTALHPDYKTLVELAFEIEGISYYAFKNSTDMPPKRHEKMNQFIKELDMRINAKDLVEDMDLIMKCGNKGDLVSIVQIASSVKNNVSLYIETDTYYRLFTCGYFTLEPLEDLTDYDFDYNIPKIEAFKAMPPGDFFFLKHLNQYLPQMNISSQDFQTFSKLTKRNKLYREKVRSDVTKSLSKIGNGSGGQ